MYKQFFRCVLPSMLAFAFSGLYTIVDGFFIGRNVGDVGLAAVNIAFPLAALVQAVGTGIGMGGAIQITVCRGREKPGEEARYFGGVLRLLLTAGLAMTVLLFLFHDGILSALGARGPVLSSGAAYLRPIAMGAVFQLCATGFAPLLRNFGRPLLAMGAMISGFLTNILLDWLFVSVLGYGMAGAAWATVIGQAVTVLPCLPLLLQKASSLGVFRQRVPSAVLLQILRVGASPFGLTMSPFLVTILLNKWAVAYGGSEAVAAYAVVAYVTAIIVLLLQGIGDGSQPLISLCLGEGRPEDARRLRNLAYLFSCLVAAVAGGIILALVPVIPGVFGASESVSRLAAEAFPYFLSGFFFVAFCRVTTAYFYATQRNLPACVMVYGEPLLLTALLCAFPRGLGLGGVWLSSPTAQLLLTLVGFWLVRQDKRNAHCADNINCAGKQNCDGEKIVIAKKLPSQ